MPKGKQPKLQPLLEKHYGISLAEIFQRFKKGTSCREVAKILEQETGTTVNSATLYWLSKHKTSFKFTGRRGRKLKSTLGENANQDSEKEKSIVHYQCLCCESIHHRKEVVGESLCLRGYICSECSELGKVRASYFVPILKRILYKTVTLVAGKPTEIFIDQEGIPTDPPLMVINEKEKQHDTHASSG